MEPTGLLGKHIRCAKEGVDDWDKVPSADASEAPRCSTRSLPVTAQMEDPEYGTAFAAFVVVATIALMAVLIFVPARAGASPFGKFYLAGVALICMKWGLTRIHSAWKARKLRTDGPNAVGAIAGHDLVEPTRGVDDPSKPAPFDVGAIPRRLASSQGLRIFLSVIAVLIAFRVAFLVFSPGTVVVDRSGGFPRLLTPQFVSVLQISAIVEQLKAQGNDGSWAAFAFVPKGAPVTDDATVNLQYSVEKGRIGLDWVLLGLRNRTDREEIIAFIKQRSHTVLEKEVNGVKSLRVEDGNISELGVQIVEEVYQLGRDDDLTLFTDHFVWKQ